MGWRLRLYMSEGFNRAGSEWTHELTIERDASGAIRAQISYNGELSEQEGPWISPPLADGSALWDWITDEWQTRTDEEFGDAMKSAVLFSLRDSSSDFAESFSRRWGEEDE